MLHWLRLPQKAYVVICAVMAAGVAAVPVPVHAAQVGTLNCDVSGGLGLVIVQKQTMSCTFHPAGGGPVSHYHGTIAEYGLALGSVTEGHLVWGVIAATKNVKPGALAGSYAGVGAQASAGVGAGANVLVGGNKKAFSLQPLSLEGQTGINIAAGVTSLKLTAAH
jgi:hypothetical protein